MRLDQAVSRLFGLSRTVAAALVEGGDVLVDGAAPAKSDKVSAGSWLEVLAAGPGRRRPVESPSRSTACVVVYSDDDIVVVDKPVGVAAHASPGWTGPTVTGGLAAMGHTIATSGAAERQGVVHRLDVGHHRADGRGEERDRVQPCSSGRSRPARSTRSTTPWCRATWTRCGAPSTPRSTGIRPTTTSGRSSPAGATSITHYDTLEAFAGASLVEISLETGRTHQIRVHMSALRHPCVGDLTYGADPTLAARLGLDAAVAARRRARVRPSRHRRAGALRQSVPGRPGARPGRAAQPARMRSVGRRLGRGARRILHRARAAHPLTLVALVALVAVAVALAVRATGPPPATRLPTGALPPRVGVSEGDQVADVRAGEPGRARALPGRDGRGPRLRAGHPDRVRSTRRCCPRSSRPGPTRVR